MIYLHVARLHTGRRVAMTPVSDGRNSAVSRERWAWVVTCYSYFIALSLRHDAPRPGHGRLTCQSRNWRCGSSAYSARWHRRRTRRAARADRRHFSPILSPDHHLSHTTMLCVCLLYRISVSTCTILSLTSPFSRRYSLLKRKLYFLLVQGKTW